MRTQQLVILTAGKGTRMGSFAASANKAILPLKGKAIISHIIDSFHDNMEIIIALGYKGKQVKEYISMAHPKANVKYVEVDKFEGKGSGPGYSLKCCKSVINGPFFFISCDTLFKLNLMPQGNWVGIKKIKTNPIDYCNILLDEEGLVIDIKDKEFCTNAYSAFSGLMHIRDTDIFWEGLNESLLVGGELQISNGIRKLMLNNKIFGVELEEWTDVGDFAQYRRTVEKSVAFDFSKTGEFLYIGSDRVVKFFENPSNVKGRVKKAELKPNLFPDIHKIGEQFFSYYFAPGKTLYQYCSPKLFDRALNCLEESLWTSCPTPNSYMEVLCEKFYKTKTFNRLREYDCLYPGDHSETYKVLKKVPWFTLFNGIPYFIHGDLHFDHILHHKGRFTLLDWRQDFAGETKFGDLYYDFAKMYGGLILNYRSIRLGKKSEPLEDYQKILKEYITNRGYDFWRVKIITALIFLNMSPLHHPPFSQMLHKLGTEKLKELLQ